MAFLRILILLCTAPALYSQNGNPVYDSLLARQLEADDYGMKSYVWVILKTGGNDTAQRNFIDSCFAGHMANIHRLAEAGDLVLAGPMFRNKEDIRGIFVLKAASVEAADSLLQSDPAIAADLLSAHCYRWYGPAALPTYLETQDKIWRKKP